MKRNTVKHTLITLSLALLVALAAFGCGGFTSSSEPFALYNGSLLIADPDNGRIVSIRNMSGDGWIEFGVPGNGIGQLRPQDLAVGPDRRIFIADGVNMRIVRIDDLSGSGWTEFMPDFGGEDVGALTRIDVGADGKIYFLMFHGRMYRVDDMSGANMTLIDDQSSTHDIAVNDTGDLFHVMPREIIKNTRSGPSGGFLVGIGGDFYDEILAIDLDEQGRIYTCEYDILPSSKIRVIRVDDITGANPVKLDFLGGPSIAVGANERFYVWTGEEIVAHDGFDGEAIARYGSHGSGKHRFSKSAQIHVVQ